MGLWDLMGSTHHMAPYRGELALVGSMAVEGLTMPSWMAEEVPLAQAAHMGGVQQVTLHPCPVDTVLLAAQWAIEARAVDPVDQGVPGPAPPATPPTTLPITPCLGDPPRVPMTRPPSDRCAQATPSASTQPTKAWSHGLFTVSAWLTGHG